MDRGIMSAPIRIALSLALASVLAACATLPPGKVSRREMAQIETALTRDITTLASEEFGGRKPGTPGEELTLDYMQAQMARAGLVSGTNDPANPWRAPVTLYGSKSLGGTIEINAGRSKIVLPAERTAVFTSRKRSLVEAAPLLFVGFEAERLNMDDIRGKVVAMLAESGVSPRRRSILFDKGAAAVITLVEDQGSVEQTKRFAGRERFALRRDEDSSISAYATHADFAAAIGEKKFAELVAASSGEDFKPVTLPAKVDIEALSEQREILSHNIIGKIEGGDPAAGAVLLLAHWDHLGECGAPEDEDRLCNGAVDNASGVAVMMELARRLKASGSYDRDIYVLGTTAEESGLLGIEAFVENPPVPLESIVAAFNFDTVAIAPAGSMIGFLGEGRTPLDDVVKQAVAQVGREIGNRELSAPYLQRQDGWALLQRDVPAVVLSSAFGNKAALELFLLGRYHRAADEADQLELGGAIEDMLLHEILVKKVASKALYPQAAN